MTNSVTNSLAGTTTKIIPPPRYEKYEYEVNINGEKQMASVEKTPDGKVTIKVGDKTIVTDKEGLMEFNKNYKPKDIIYNMKPEEKPEEEKSGWSKKAADALKSLAMLQVLRRPSTNMDTINESNRMFEMNNQIALQMHQQAMQDHMTAVQMTTPGMGII